MCCRSLPGVHMTMLVDNILSASSLRCCFEDNKHHMHKDDYRCEEMENTKN